MREQQLRTFRSRQPRRSRQSISFSNGIRGSVVPVQEPVSWLLPSLWCCCRVRNRCGRVRVQLGAKGEQKRLERSKRHTVDLPRVAPDFRDERLLVSGAGLEPAFAMNRFVHGFLPPTL